MMSRMKESRYAFSAGCVPGARFEIESETLRKCFGWERGTPILIGFGRLDGKNGNIGCEKATFTDIML
jgi:hypothetical protein